MFDKSLDDILKSFTKTQKDLYAFIDRNNTKSNENQSKLIELEAEQVKLKLSTDRATKVLKNVEKLLGD